MADQNDNRWGWMWAIFTVRWVLGLIFFMAGWWKCFTLGPVEHARKFFLNEDFEGHWIPDWMHWAIGTTIPVVELVAGRQDRRARPRADSINR